MCLNDIKIGHRTYCEVRALYMHSHSAILPFLHLMVQTAIYTGLLPLTHYVVSVGRVDIAVSCTVLSSSL